MTLGFQILSFIQAGAPLGLSTCTLSPVNTCSFFVPRSRSMMSVWPRLAALRAAWRGALQPILESIKPGQKWLFPGRSSGHLCTKTVLRTIDRLAEEAGVQEISRKQKLSRRKVTPHILRHSHVVNALMAGVPVPMIHKQVGHKRLSTTEIYATVAPALVKEAYDLHGFGPSGI